MQSYSPGDVVVVPFPFTDRATSKRRPALVVSSTAFNRGTAHLVLAMITSTRHSAWPGDVTLRDIGVTGLPSASIVRWKLFTLDVTLVRRTAGALSARDRSSCRKQQPVTL
jgi:mRNA interferase MazF